MKSYLFITILLLSFPVYGKEGKELDQRLRGEDCREYYQRKINKRVSLHDKINEHFFITASASLVFAFIYPVVSGALIGVHYGAMLYSSFYGSEKGNIFNLHYLDTDEGKNLFKEMNQIDQEKSNVDIFRIVEKGFESGDFCANLPTLVTLDEVKDYIKGKILEGKIEKDLKSLEDVLDQLNPPVPMRDEQTCEWTYC